MREYHMDNQIEEFTSARTKLIHLLEKFPQEKREDVIFDQWSLKDVLIHIAGWDQCYLDGLYAIQDGSKGVWNGNVDEVNKTNVAAGKHLTYDEAYQRFLETSQKVIDESKALTINLWEKLLYEGRKYTLKKFLRTLIRHYEEEHIPGLKLFV
jgi:uncharacterized damage-inducible protein DinB